MRFFLWALPLPELPFLLPMLAVTPVHVSVYSLDYDLYFCSFWFLIYNSPTHLFIHFWENPTSCTPKPSHPPPSGTARPSVCPVRVRPSGLGLSVSACSSRALMVLKPAPLPYVRPALSRTSPPTPIPTLTPPEGERLLYCRGRSGN